jgi:proline iminopeptidase
MPYLLTSSVLLTALFDTLGIMQHENNEPPAPIDNTHIIRSGRMAVSDGHEIYWVDWGNSAIEKPIFYLHGGPGSGFSERDFNKFDPSKQHVVFHDQRGSGRSTPFASIDHNTTADLISDITKLRYELGFDKISLYGRSWGATLALLYAIAYPERIDKMLIGGIFLGRDVDSDFYFNGAIATHFPEVWERFSGMVPRDAGIKVSEYYRKKLLSDDRSEQQKFANEWALYETSIMKLDYVPANIERAVSDVPSQSLALLEAHYLLNHCFIEDNYILENVDKLASLEKIIIVQGRYDFVCIPSAAYDLKNALGDNAILQIVTAGHASGDTVLREVERAYINLLW